MAYVFYCNNPKNKCHIGDCAIRSISKATNYDWYSTYMDLVQQGYEMADLPNSNEVVSAYLYKKGFRRYGISSDRPDDYTIDDFRKDHPSGIYILCTGTHMVCQEDNLIYDTWDSTSEIPQYYFKKER